MVREVCRGLLGLAFVSGVTTAAQEPGLFPAPKIEPPIVTPGKRDADPPSDAIVLFNGKDLGSKVIDRARVTVFHNGVLVQNNAEIYGLAYNDRPALYIAHDPQASLRLQDHGNPVRYRNIWIRRL